MDIKGTIAVIGAGISGIQTAHQLVKAGYEVVVIEASNRVGGRLWSHKTESGGSHELGAQFLHNDAEGHLVREGLGNRVGCVDGSNLVPFSLEDALVKAEVFEQGNRYALDESQSGDILDVYEGITQMQESGFSSIDDIPSFGSLYKSVIDEVIDGDAKTKEGIYHLATNLFTDGVPGSAPASYSFGPSFYDLDQPGENGIIEMGAIGEDGNDCYMAEASEIMVNRLATGLNIVTGARVTDVEEDAGNRMTVKYMKDGEMVSTAVDKVVSAVSLDVVQRGAIKLPELSKAKKEAIDSLKMKNVRKLLFTFSKEAFDKAGLDSNALIFPDRGKGDVFLNLDRISQGKTESTLVAFVLGDNASAMDKEFPEGSDDLKKQMIDVLSDQLPSLNLESLVSYSDKAWGQDPDTHGAYSYVDNPEGYNFKEALTTSECGDNLFFVGEFTNLDDGYEGTIHGAMASGNRVANQIIRSFEESV